MAIQRIIILFLLLFCYGVVFVSLRIWFLMRIGAREAYRQRPFAMPLPAPEQRMLFVGDSLVVGIGASAPEHTVAGRVSTTFPGTHVDNLGACGARVHDLAQTFAAINSNLYDAIVIQIGGNDVVRLTPLDELRRDLARALSFYRRHAKQVILMGYGNIGQTSRFWWPLQRMYGIYSVALRDTFAQLANEHDVTFIDFLDPDIDPTVDPKRYLCADGLHPNDEGYLRYFHALKNRLSRVGPNTRKHIAQQ